MNGAFQIKNKESDKAYSVLAAARLAEPEPKLDWEKFPGQKQSGQLKIEPRQDRTRTYTSMSEKSIHRSL